MAGPQVIKIYQQPPSGRDIAADVPLSQIAVQQFANAAQLGYVALELFKVTPPVAKDSGRYYIVDKNSWFVIPDDRRAQKASPNRVEFKVSSDLYYCQNYALAGEIAKEDLARQDPAINLYETTVQVVTEALLRRLEVRVANQVTSISNVGSGVTLTGGDTWNDYVNSDPLAAVNTAHAFAVANTGLMYNTMILPWDVYQVVRRHPLLLDMFKYTKGGMLTGDELTAVFQVQRVLVPRGIVNNQLEGSSAASFTRIWGNNVVLAYVADVAPNIRTTTFGLAIRWMPEGFPAPMQARRYEHWDPGVGTVITDVMYWQAEKIVAPQLGYLITAF
jgi:hypothetical protein